MSKTVYPQKKLVRTLVLIAVMFGIFLIGVYLLQLPISTAILSSLLFPIAIILLGKTAELIINLLQRASTVSLSFTESASTLSLMFYYASFTVLLAFLIENSAVLSILNFTPSEAQVAITSLGLAFLPRVISYASGMERARTILLQILTPLTLTSVVVLIFQPTSIVPRLQTLEFCVLGSIVTPITGDLTLYLAGFLGIIHPRITFETISLLNLQRLVKSQLETLGWDSICEILKQAKTVNRYDISQKVHNAMSLFIDESRKRRANLARISFVDSLIKAVHSAPHLEEDLAPFLEALQHDQDGDVRARIVYYYRVRLGQAKDEGPEKILDFLKDQDIRVLDEVAIALTHALRRDPKVTSYIVELSLNPAFLDWLLKNPSLQIQRGGSGIMRSRYPIVVALEAAYKVSPDEVFEHIKNCSSSRDVRKRALAAEVVSGRIDDARLAPIREELKKDRNLSVRMRLEPPLTRFSEAELIARVRALHNINGEA